MPFLLELHIKYKVYKNPIKEVKSLSEIDDMYSSNDYKQLRKACDEHNEAGIRTWYTQLQMGYSSVMLKEVLGSVEHLVDFYAKK